MNTRSCSLRRPLTAACALLLVGIGNQVCHAQTGPLFSSWLTNFSGRYARVTQTTGGTSVTTWPAAGLPKMGGGQATPAYADVQQISYSANYVYIKGTGLASHPMGPWYNNGAIFGNWPSNTKYIRRFPRSPAVAATKTTNGLGSIGLWVNGVAMYNLLDAFSYNTASGADVQSMMAPASDWVRNAVVTEAPTFDKSNAHQPPNGEYHYHDSPNALRYQFGDNMTYNAATGAYSEDATRLHHSPILGWAYDGYPIYGPYAYANPNDPASGVRRMVSGFVIRNGSYGTTNLSAAGRHSLGAWAAALHNTAQTLASSQYGPTVSASYPLGRYVEDFDYLGDHGYVKGRDFDLDVYNGRFCVTPEYPGGTYAYFVTLDSGGAPAFPYIIGRQYYGTPSGGQVASMTEAVTVAKDAGPYTALQSETLHSANGKRVKWLSIEGGHYKLEGSPDGATWTTLVASVTSGGLSTAYTFAAGSANANYAYYRATLISTDTYDPAPH